MSDRRYRNAYARSWYALHRETERAKARARTAANPEKRALYRRTYRATHPVEDLFNTTRQRARVRGIAFTLTLEWLKERLAPMVCEVEGKKLRWDIDRPTDLRAPSLDRKDQRKGYCPENTRVVSWGFNCLRGPHSDEEVLDWQRSGS